ncbi:MAG: hypothetical protein JSR40_20435 [Proteobacteria bacterium]|nr:hypothetical protein [Pseudomonadota bacterium]
MNTALLPDLVKLLDWGGTLAFAFSGGLLGARSCPRGIQSALRVRIRCCSAPVRASSCA